MVLSEYLTIFRGLSPLGAIALRTNLRLAAMLSRGWIFGRWRTDSLDHAHHWGREVVESLELKVLQKGMPPRRPCLYMANHRSYIDIPVMLALTRSAFLAKKEVRSYPSIGTAADLIGCVFVDRQNKESRRESRQRIADSLTEGWSVIAFPEGTTKPEGPLLPFFPGSFELAAEGGFPVVPVAISYPDRDIAWNGDTEGLIRFGKRRLRGNAWVRTSFGPPIYSRDPRALMEATREWIERDLGLYERRDVA